MTIRQTDIKRIKDLTKAIESRQRSKPMMTAEEAAAMYERSLSEDDGSWPDGVPHILVTHTAEEAAEIYRRFAEDD